MLKKIINEQLLKSIDKRFDKVDKRLDKHDDRLDKHDDKFDKFLIEQIDMKEDLKNVKQNMMTKNDKSEILDAIDAVAGDLKSMKEENISNQAAHNRIQGDDNEVRGHVGMDIKNPVLSGA